MQYTELYADQNQQTQFKTCNIELPHHIDLGDYSEAFGASHVIFWSFKAGNLTQPHTAPQTQFVILLKGRIAIQALGGERREFNAGDILLANNLTGPGHISETLETGMGLLIPKEALGERLLSLFSPR